jgi:hypothetical protein
LGGKDGRPIDSLGGVRSVLLRVISLSEASTDWRHLLYGSMPLSSDEGCSTLQCVADWQKTLRQGTDWVSVHGSMGTECPSLRLGASILCWLCTLACMDTWLE